jgi:hypothetical protein
MDACSKTIESTREQEIGEAIGVTLAFKALKRGCFIMIFASIIRAALKVIIPGERSRLVLACSLASAYHIIEQFGTLARR